MKKQDVPQHAGLTAGCREVSYAVDDDGRYALALSHGWEPKTVALSQAWEAIIEQLQQVLDDVRAGRKSPLAYHMSKNQMDAALLAQYAGVARWRVRRHLVPTHFARLDTAILTRYAELFGISIEQLRRVPDQPDLCLADLESFERRDP